MPRASEERSVHTPDKSDTSLRVSDSNDSQIEKERKKILPISANTFLLAGK